MTNVGDSCTNGPWEQRWTCPECYNDHHEMVDFCTSCGVALSCTIERNPVPVCTIVDVSADEDD